MEQEEYYSTKSWCWFRILVDGEYHTDLTASLTEVKIINSITNNYGIYQLFFHTDNELWIRDDLYPKRDFTLQIFYADEKGNPTNPPIIFNLLILENNIDLNPKVQNNVEDRRDSLKQVSCCTCISVQAFEIWSAIVNRMWESDGISENTISPYDAIMQLVKDVGITDKEIEEEGKNDKKLDQLIIPPMSFISAFNWINDMYGIYENQVIGYVQYNGTFTMWDIVKHFNKNKSKGEITLHKLPNFAINDEPKQATIKAQGSAKDFVCYDTVQTNQLINDIVTQRGYDQTYIYHPPVDIAHYYETDINKEYQNHGIISGNPDMKMHKKMAKRRVVNYDKIGMMKSWRSFDHAENPLITKMSEQLIGLDVIRFNIVRQFKIHNLIRIGHVLYLKPYSQHETYQNASYEGAYLITSSEITLTRYKDQHLGDTVDTRASICGYRTNQSFN